MFFDKDTFKLGGKVKVPDSFTNKTDYGEIILITPAGIAVEYRKANDSVKQICFYNYSWLNHHYGPKGNDLNDDISDLAIP